LGYSQESDPVAVAWTQAGVEMVLECSGKFKTPQTLQPYFDQLGLKRVEVYVNGKRVMMKSPEELNKKEEHYEWNIDEKEIHKFFVPGEENQVKVIGIVQQGNNEMQSRGVVEEVEPTKEEKQHPTFY
jgi:hydroxymethylpyrimidine pyrophosphatase-like HAD family hydrolase